MAFSDSPATAPFHVWANSCNCHFMFVLVTGYYKRHGWRPSLTPESRVATVVALSLGTQMS